MYMKEEDWIAYKRWDAEFNKKCTIISIIVILIVIIVGGLFIAYRVNNPAPAKPASIMQDIGSTVTIDGEQYHASQFVTTSGTAKDVHFVLNTITNELKVVWKTGNTTFNTQQHSENTGLLYTPATD